MGGPEEMDINSRVRRKIESYGHQEFNNDFYLSKIPEKISDGTDIFDRKKSRFKLLTNYSYLPPYIIDNLEEYSYLIKGV
jgi:hypothetical protein